MSYEMLSNDALLAKASEIRKNLQEYENQLSKKDNSVDYNRMRREMTDLNHVKMEAKKRGLNID